ncbi:MAG: Omp28-related outer membrane protein [bacterium]
MSWPAPGNDPWYLANTTENTDRRTYYGVNAIPTIRVDGIYSPNAWNAASIQSNITTRLAQSSPIEIQTDVQVVGDSIHLSLQLTSDQNLSAVDLRLHSALVEQEVILSPTPNGETVFKYPMVDLAPTGLGIPFSIGLGEQLEFQNTFVLSQSWSLMNLLIVCFVQNYSTKEILQAAYAEIPIDFPNILLSNYDVDDIGGNNDGRVDPGETGQMVVTLQNQLYFNDAENVVATLSTTDPQITITMPTISYPALGSGASITNTSNPFQFDVDPGLEPHEVSFNLHVTADPGSFEADFPMTFMVGRPDFLLVNDDLSGGFQSWYEESLDSLGLVYDRWNQVQQGMVPLPEMNAYPIVIWYTGNDNQSVLSTYEQENITDYLNSGGRLLFSSQNAGDLLGSSAFYQDVLHSEHLVSSTNEYLLNGVSEDPISDGSTVFLVGSTGAGNANSSSSLNPISPAVGIYTYQTAGTYGALRYADETYRLVYFAFAVEAISGGMQTTTRRQVLENCIAWLQSITAVEPSSEQVSLPERLEIVNVTPNPFNPAAILEFTVPQPGLVKVDIYDLQGRLVQHLLNRSLNVGNHRVIFDAGNNPSGIYLVTLRSGNTQQTTKAILLK